LYKNPAEISLPNSKELAIRITAVLAPANNFERPVTEKNAAADAMKRADNPNKKVLSFTL